MDDAAKALLDACHDHDRQESTPQHELSAEVHQAADDLATFIQMVRHPAAIIASQKKRQTQKNRLFRYDRDKTRVKARSWVRLFKFRTSKEDHPPESVFSNLIS